MKGVRHPRRGGLTYRLFVGLTPLLLIYAIISYLAIDQAPDFGMEQRFFRIIHIDPGRPADKAGFRVGDEITMQNGVPTSETVRLIREHGKIRPGDEVEFSILRDGETVMLTVTAEQKTGEEKLRILVRLIVGSCFLLVGLVVYWNRCDKVSTTFYLLGAAFALLIFEPPATGNVTLQLLIKIARDASLLFLAPLFLCFCLSFPHAKRVPSWLVPLRSIFTKSRCPVRFPLYIVSLILWILSSVLSILFFVHGSIDPIVFALFQGITVLFLLSCILSGIAAFIHSFAKTREPLMRRRLRGVLIGTVIALVPMAVVNVLKQANPGIHLPGSPCYSMLMIFLPISFGHAIVRYGLFDLELIIKRSALYGLLTAFLAMVYLVLIDILKRLFQNVTGNTDIPATVISIFLLALLFSPAREYIQKWVDRTFYPEKHAYRRTLQEFSTALTSIIDMKTLLGLMVERISSTLHSSSVVVFLPNEEGTELTLQAAAGHRSVDLEGMRFTSDEPLLHVLRESNDILPMEHVVHPRNSDIFSSKELTRLGDLDASLLLPLKSGEEMVGFISLGKKRSEEIYSHEDRQLLKIFANQAALAIENARLHHNTLEKEKMEQELKLAGDIQKQFLPSAPPKLDGVEIAAINDPCDEIGGDYYDYIVRGPKAVGLAIGDAAGHGVTAALLMANLQASFRAEAIGTASPSSVLGNINRTMYRRTQTARFVTFYYCLLDLKSGILRYSNAGHNPPILIHADGAAEYLTESDLILGVDESVVYHEHAVEMVDGDMVVLYTDGVTDELNSEEESFGDERLKDLLVRNRSMPVEDLVALVRDKVMAFMGGGVGDDLTLLIFRYVPDGPRSSTNVRPGCPNSSVQ